MIDFYVTRQTKQTNKQDTDWNKNKQNIYIYIFVWRQIENLNRVCWDSVHWKLNNKKELRRN